MNRITKISVLTAALAAALPFVCAADPVSPAPAPGANAPAAVGHPHERGFHRQAAFHRMARRLHLTPAQIGQIKAIRGSTYHAIAAIRSNASLTPDQRHAQIHDLRAASRRQIAALLTPDQKARLARIHRRVEDRLGGF